MKKVIMAFGVLLVSASAFSAHSAFVGPMVRCELVYSMRDAQGNTIDSKTSQTMTLTLSQGGTNMTFEGYTLEAALAAISAADGGPALGYEIGATIKKGDVSSYGVQTVSKSAKNKRLSSALNVGREQAFVNCDFTQ